MKKILSPITRLQDVLPLINAGADEFYCGFSNQFFVNANKREHPGANFQDIDIFQQVTELVKQRGKKIFLALNELTYSESENDIISYIQFLEQYNFDGYIVQDHLLLKVLSDINTKKQVHLSSLAQVWNTDAINFYLNKFPNISRIILSRDIVVPEIKKIVKLFPKIKFEIFILNEWCYNVDGICSSRHYIKGDEKFKYVCRREHLYRDNFNNKVNFKEFSPNIRDQPSCYVCSMYFLSALSNLESLKIVGRGKPQKKLLQSINLVSAVHKFLEEKTSYEQFLSKVQKRYLKIYNKNCDAKICQFANLSNLEYFTN